MYCRGPAVKTLWCPTAAATIKGATTLWRPTAKAAPTASLEAAPKAPPASAAIASAAIAAAASSSPAKASHWLRSLHREQATSKHVIIRHM